MTLHSSQMGRGHRDDRRRRLLAEDRTANSELVASNLPETSLRNVQPPAHKSENYGEAEFLQTQLRLTDLIPRRLISYLLLFKVGLAAIAALIALYLWIPQLLGDPSLRPELAELGSRGSLGNWFASLLLLTASLLAIVIYSVRRHKVDDYHGRYHVWLWAAIAWFMMSTDVAAGLHRGLQQVMIALTGSRIAGDGSIWWIVPTILIMGTIGSRLLIDMRFSRLSSLALIFSGIAYATAFAVYLHGITLQSGVHELLLTHGGLLCGHLLLAISMALHARYVILDAEGALPKRIVKKKAVKKRAEKKSEKKIDKDPASASAAIDTPAPVRGSVGDRSSSVAKEPDDEEEPDESADDEESSDTWVAVDPPHGKSQPVLKRVVPAQTTSSSPLGQKVAAVGMGNSASASGDDSKLGKADRKALKKKLLEERLQRERKTSNW